MKTEQQHKTLRLDGLFELYGSTRSSIAPGWKLVPVEPTPEMLGAARNAPLPAINLDSFSAQLDLRSVTCYHAMLGAAPQPPVGKEQPHWPKLDKPARVGGGTFGIGTSSQHVVMAAQRAHDEHIRAGALTHEQMVEEEHNRRKLWDLIHGSAAAPQPPVVELPTHRKADQMVYPLGKLMDDAVARVKAEQQPKREPKFDAISVDQEQLAIKFCAEIAGPRGGKPSLPDPVRLLKIAEALYLAEVQSSGAIEAANGIGQEGSAA